VSAPSIAQLQAQAHDGDPWAQLNLGAAYDHGLSGLAADPVQAVYWYRQAAEQGLDKAQFNLAHCLATGHGTPQDYAAARLWMRRAAQQGMADAQFLMGVMLLEGLGGSSVADEGRAWVQRAAMGGNADAVDYLKNLR
jgi:TPR repeat protein